MKRQLTLISLLISSVGVFAAEPASPLNINWVNVMIYTFAFFLLLITIVLYRTAIHLKRYAKGELEARGLVDKNKQNYWERIFQIKPVGTDKDTLINEPHDGIYELDNPPPPWFMFLFYGCVVFAVFYMIRYQFTDMGPTQEEEYIAEMEAAEEQKAAFLVSEDASMDESTVTLLTDEESIAAGMAIYEKKACGACHGNQLEGKMGLGPNLVDEYWKHGGGIKNVFSTIKYGVVTKGMRPWDGELTPEMMQQVGSYILSLQGSNPPNAQKPEGEKWVPEEAEEPEVEENSDESDDLATN